jgi:Ribbon-helix-helix protein, copG family
MEENKASNREFKRTMRAKRQKKRAKKTIKTPLSERKFNPNYAEDTQLGVSRVVFPTFRVDEDDLGLINQIAEKTGVDRSVLMRSIIRQFIQKNNE